MKCSNRIDIEITFRMMGKMDGWRFQLTQFNDAKPKSPYEEKILLNIPTNFLTIGSNPQYMTFPSGYSTIKRIGQ